MKSSKQGSAASWLTCSGRWPKKSFVIQPIFPFSILKKSSSRGQKLQRICSAAGNHKSSWRQSSGEEVASAAPSCPSVLLSCCTAQTLRACSALPAMQPPQKREQLLQPSSHHQCCILLHPLFQILYMWTVCLVLNTPLHQQHSCISSLPKKQSSQNKATFSS